jgi:uncharacterized coiled-coil protein SlyX
MKKLLLVVLVTSLVLFACTASASAKTPTPKSLAKSVAALQKKVAAQARTITSLSKDLASAKQVTSAQGQTIASLSAQLGSAGSRLAGIEANKALALGPYVSVTTDALNGVRGPHIIFTGANLDIRSGSGATDDNALTGGALSGLGNLIIGYDEPVTDGLPQPRTGSHCLIVGAEHTFQSYGGFVAGWRNNILAPWTSVSGGLGNSASGTCSSASGGQSNLASGVGSSVSGGWQSVAGGSYASVSGGESNTASEEASSVSGGNGNEASGQA